MTTGTPERQNSFAATTAPAPRRWRLNARSTERSTYSGRSAADGSSEGESSGPDDDEPGSSDGVHPESVTRTVPVVAELGLHSLISGTIHHVGHHSVPIQSSSSAPGSNSMAPVVSPQNR